MHGNEIAVGELRPMLKKKKKKVTKTRWEGLKCCWSCRHWGMLWNNMRKKWCEALLENHSLWNASVQCLNPPTNLLTDQPTAVTSPLGWHVGGIVNVRFQCLFFLFFSFSRPLPFWLSCVIKSTRLFPASVRAVNDFPFVDTLKMYSQESDAKWNVLV